MGAERGDPWARLHSLNIFCNSWDQCLFFFLNSKFYFQQIFLQSSVLYSLCKLFVNFYHHRSRMECHLQGPRRSSISHKKFHFLTSNYHKCLQISSSSVFSEILINYSYSGILRNTNFSSWVTYKLRDPSVSSDTCQLQLF